MEKKHQITENTMQINKKKILLQISFLDRKQTNELEQVLKKSFQKIEDTLI